MLSFGQFGASLLNSFLLEMFSVGDRFGLKGIWMQYMMLLCKNHIDHECYFTALMLPDGGC